MLLLLPPQGTLPSAPASFNDAQNTEITAKELSDIGSVVASATVTSAVKYLVIMTN